MTFNNMTFKLAELTNRCKLCRHDPNIYMKTTMSMCFAAKDEKNIGIYKIST